MQEQYFALYLTGRYPQSKINSYLAYCRRVERLLSIDLTSCELGPQAVDRIAAQLAKGSAHAMARSSARNCMAADQHYAAFHAGSIRPALAVSPSEPVALTAQVPRPELVNNTSVRDLKTLNGQIMDELRDRKVVRTANSPVGGYAEQLFARAFDWKLDGNSAAGHDAEGHGIRYQIKARRISVRNPSRQLSAIRRLPDTTFDVLAAVLFDEHFTVLRAAFIPHDVVPLYATWVEHTNSWRFMLDDKVWQMSGVKPALSTPMVARPDVQPMCFLFRNRTGRWADHSTQAPAQKNSALRATLLKVVNNSGK